ncbi:hypothetical protein BVY01_05260 [bacterium I07]|nr:hypothetical protein BVY01_05260 [bacterium I07]
MLRNPSYKSSASSGWESLLSAEESCKPIDSAICDRYLQSFRFRNDVFATLHYQKGRKLYFPECQNRSTPECRIKKVESPCHNCPVKERAPVTPHVVKEHLLGTKVCAFYPLLPDGTSQMFALDFDHDNTFFEMEKVYSDCLGRGIHTYPATSTTKGNYHLYLLLKKPIQAQLGRLFFQDVCEKLKINPLPEIFPKQSAASDIGNPIRTPLSIPDMEQGQCAFLDPESSFEPFDVDAQFEFLNRLKLCPCEDVLQFVDSINRLSGSSVKTYAPSIFPKQLKPCVESAIRKGTTRGKRNDTGLIITTELKRLGNRKGQILGVIAAWNLRNEPPLSKPELRKLIHSALIRSYSYGCRNGEVKETLDCIGLEHCEYYQAYLKQKNRE